MPLTPPLISKSPVATIPLRSAPLRLGEIHAPTIGEILVYRSTLQGLASNAFRLLAPEDAGRHVSSVAPLTILRRSNIPALLQRLADLGLAQRLSLRPIFGHALRLSVFRDKLRRFHIIRFPIKIENLIFRPQKVFRMPMTFEAPAH